MKTITLDLIPFTDSASLQGYLMQVMDFPFYYGKNLDALYDELTAWQDQTHFILRLPLRPEGGMADYLPRLAAVFADAANQNPDLDVTVERI